MFTVALATILVAVGAIYSYLYLWAKSDDKSTVKSSSESNIPCIEPRNTEEGNVPDIAEAGSLTEFLNNIHEKFGPVVRFWLKETEIISIASPETFKQVSHLFDRPVELFKNLEPLIGPGSVQFRNGALGQQTRKLHDREFSHTKLSLKLPMFQQVGEELVSRWSKMADTKEHIPLSMHMSITVITALTRFAFGDYFKDKEESLVTFRHDYDHVFWILENYLVDRPLPPGSDEEKSFQQGLSRMKSVISDIIKWRQEQEISPEDKVFIDILLDNYDNEDMLFGDVISYFIAGSHTTSFFVFWVLYHMAKHEHVQERCYQEICEHYQDGQLDWEIMKNMKYMKAVMDETQRVTPLAPYAAREVPVDMTIGGYAVPKGAKVLMSLHTIAWDEKYWPEPQKFDPERFMDMSKIPAYQFEPFSFGKRKCPGYRMAEMEGQAFLAVILKNYKISLVSDQPVTYKYGILTKPSDEVYVTIERRT